jgi:HSP90 family molecular chaperone
MYIEALIDGIDLNIQIKREILEQAPIFTIINEKLQ